MRKRILSLMIALVMVMSILPVATVAEYDNSRLAKFKDRIVADLFDRLTTEPVTGVEQQSILEAGWAKYAAAIADPTQEPWVTAANPADELGVITFKTIELEDYTKAFALSAYDPADPASIQPLTGGDAIGTNAYRWIQLEKLVENRDSLSIVGDGVAMTEAELNAELAAIIDEYDQLSNYQYNVAYLNGDESDVDNIIAANDAFDMLTKEDADGKNYIEKISDVYAKYAQLYAEVYAEGGSSKFVDKDGNVAEGDVTDVIGTPYIDNTDAATTQKQQAWIIELAYESGAVHDLALFFTSFFGEAMNDMAYVDGTNDAEIAEGGFVANWFNSVVSDHERKTVAILMGNDICEALSDYASGNVKEKAVDLVKSNFGDYVSIAKGLFYNDHESAIGAAYDLGAAFFNDVMADADDLRTALTDAGYITSADPEHYADKMRNASKNVMDTLYDCATDGEGSDEIYLNLVLSRYMGLFNYGEEEYFVKDYRDTEEEAVAVYGDKEYDYKAYSARFTYEGSHVMSFLTSLVPVVTGSDDVVIDYEAYDEGKLVFKSVSGNAKDEPFVLSFYRAREIDLGTDPASYYDEAVNVGAIDVYSFIEKYNLVYSETSEEEEIPINIEPEDDVVEPGEEVTIIVPDTVPDDVKDDPETEIKATITDEAGNETEVPAHFDEDGNVVIDLPDDLDPGDYRVEIEITDKDGNKYVGETDITITYYIALEDVADVTVGESVTVKGTTNLEFVIIQITDTNGDDVVYETVPAADFVAGITYDTAEDGTLKVGTYTVTVGDSEKATDTDDFEVKEAETPIVYTITLEDVADVTVGESITVKGETNLEFVIIQITDTNGDDVVYETVPAADFIAGITYDTAEDGTLKVGTYTITVGDSEKATDTDDFEVKEAETPITYTITLDELTADYELGDTLTVKGDTNLDYVIVAVYKPGHQGDNDYAVYYETIPAADFIAGIEITLNAPQFEVADGYTVVVGDSEKAATANDDFNIVETETPITYTITLDELTDDYKLGDTLTVKGDTNLDYVIVAVYKPGHQGDNDYAVYYETIPAADFIAGIEITLDAPQFEVADGYTVVVGDSEKAATANDDFNIVEEAVTETITIDNIDDVEDGTAITVKGTVENIDNVKIVITNKAGDEVVNETVTAAEYVAGKEYTLPVGEYTVVAGDVDDDPTATTTFNVTETPITYTITLDDIADVVDGDAVTVKGTTNLDNVKIVITNKAGDEVVNETVTAAEYVAGKEYTLPVGEYTVVASDVDDDPAATTTFKVVAKEVTVNIDDTEVNPGEEIEIEIETNIDPEDVETIKLIFTDEDGNTVEVEIDPQDIDEDGKVKVKIPEDLDAGDYDVTVEITDKDGNKTQSNAVGVTVENIPVTSVKINPEKASVSKGSSKDFTLKIKPDDADIIDITWSIAENPAYATITNTSKDDLTVTVKGTKVTKANTKPVIQAVVRYRNADGTIGRETVQAVLTVTSASTSGGGGGGSALTYFDVTTSVGAGGNVDVSRTTVPRGETTTITVTADPGYKLTKVTVNGEEVELDENGQYTFKVNGDSVVAANFAPIIGYDETHHEAYMQGYPDGSFLPNASMTRAEATVMFSRLIVNSMDVPGSYKGEFSDVNDGDWYADAIGYMAQSGIINGYPDGTFRPNDPITRAEFATIATRFEHLTSGDVSFTDVPEGYWAYDYIAFAAERGWVNGYEDGSFKPANNITRAEVVTVVNRMTGRGETDATSIEGFDIVKFTDVVDTHWAYYQIIEATNTHDLERNGAVEDWQ